MTCEHCNGPGTSGGSQCCWARAKEIEVFRKKVFKRYICEVIFEMVISISSVVTDIITLVFYIMKGKWLLAVLTALPVILPTAVFTNVYLSNKHRDYNRLSTQTSNGGSTVLTAENADVDLENAQDDELAQMNARLEQEQRCFNAKNCCRGCYHSCFHKDLNIRKAGKRIVRKYMRRLAKYFFGTLVLRFIAWTWYLKAVIYGYEAMKAPKKYMKIPTPDTHWSHELLIRLDFLQAALENAPQCVIQLYALLTDASEDKGLGLLTLTLSFIDFVRVATEVQWNIAKGPVVAPRGCYGSTLWKFINTCSWILLYSARSCAIALVMATSDNWTVVYPVLGFLLHLAIFIKLFSSTKFGVAAQKVFVTAFISIFFLPELDSLQVDILIQFYYAALLFENTLFIIPWRGLEHVYCEGLGGRTGNTAKFNRNLQSATQLQSTESTEPNNADCLIQPVVIVLIVPAFTVLGIILRLAAARRVARFKVANPDTEKPMTMEERVASIYNRKWTKLTYKDLLAAFVRMLRKEVSPSDKVIKNIQNIEKNKSSSRSNSLLLSGSLGSDLLASHAFIKKSSSMIVRCKDTEMSELKPDSQLERRLTYPRVKEHFGNSNTNVEKFHVEKESQNLKDEVGTISTVPQSFFAPAYIQNFTASSTGAPIFRNLEVKLLKVSPEGQVVEMGYWM